MEFGELLVDLRSEKGIYQKELAEFLHVSIGTISNYENGVHSPDLNTLCKIAEYFNVSTDYLLLRTKYRYNLQLLSKKLTPEYTVSDFLNTTLELNQENRRSLVEYVKYLKYLSKPDKKPADKSKASAEIPPRS